MENMDHKCWLLVFRTFMLLDIQFSAILIYLHANLAVQRQITKWAQVKKRKNENMQKLITKTNLYNLNNNNNNSINTNEIIIKTAES
jgi:hypothetical protein